MTQKEVALIYSYINNQRNRLENDVSYYQSQVRFRKIDTVDCLELALAIQALNTFYETSKDILILLKLASRNGGR